MSKLNERLLEERLSAGLNKSQMAKAGNVVNSAYTNYEQGLRTPDGDFLAAIARPKKEGGAGVDIVYILTGEREPDPTLLDLPSFERGIEVANRVLEIAHELGVNPGREGTKQLCLYAHQFCPTKEGLKAYIESVFALSNAKAEEDKND